LHSHSQSIAKIEAHEQESSSIYWPPQQQYQVEPPLSRVCEFEENVLAILSRVDVNDQLLHSHSQSLAKIDAQLEQIANALNREEGELPSQPMANPKGHYTVDENTSYHK
jgi:hypothetical protein